MDNRTRYEVLQNEEGMSTVDISSSDSSDQDSDNEARIVEAPSQLTRQLPEIPADTTVMLSTVASPTANEINGAQAVGPPELPSYDLATQLPSYEEAERTKAEEAAQSANRPNANHTFDKPFGDLDRFSNMQLGTDGMFLCTFIVSFLFNWLGLLVSLCITNTVAGRFGALSGFGLSMVKWVAIIKHQNWAGDVAATDSWLWWMLIMLGFLIFFRGCMQYIRIKYQWNRLGTAVQDGTYLLF